MNACAVMMAKIATDEVEHVTANAGKNAAVVRYLRNAVQLD